MYLLPRRPPDIHITNYRASQIHSSRIYPLLGTCSVVRADVLNLLFSNTTLYLDATSRPRKRHAKRALPEWHMVLMTRLALTGPFWRKPHLELFPRLQVLILKWHQMFLETPEGFAGNGRDYLRSEEGSRKMVELSCRTARNSPIRWIRKIVTAGRRRKKKFRIQLDGGWKAENSVPSTKGAERFRFSSVSAALLLLNPPSLGDTCVLIPQLC